jgi:hypothetical protein
MEEDHHRKNASFPRGYAFGQKKKLEKKREKPLRARERILSRARLCFSRMTNARLSLSLTPSFFLYRCVDDITAKSNRKRDPPPEVLKCKRKPSRT